MSGILSPWEWVAVGIVLFCDMVIVVSVYLRTRGGKGKHG